MGRKDVPCVYFCHRGSKNAREVLCDGKPKSETKQRFRPLEKGPKTVHPTNSSRKEDKRSFRSAKGDGYRMAMSVTYPAL